MNIVFDGERAPDDGVLDKMKQAAQAALLYENVHNEDIEISLTFADEDEIREINRDYREKDQVTDVLSFPQFEKPEDIPEKGYCLLGDVVICTKRAQEQADEFGHSTEREIVYLFTHSIFHLLGHDHMEEDEKAVMRRGEETVLEEIGVMR